MALALLLGGWLLSTPPGLLGKADAIGYAVCHRIEARSFHLGDRQLPLCARCSGLFLGGILGMAYQEWIGRRRMGMPPIRIALILLLLVLAFGLDGINSYLHLFPKAPVLYEPANWLRLLTGTGMGIVVAAVLLPAFNQTVWADSDPRPALGSLRRLAGLLLAGLGLDGLVLTEWNGILYALAVLSSVGVLWLLIMVYSMVLIMVLHLENRFMRWTQLGFPLAGGLFFALLQISFLDLMRFWFTRTWGGFPGIQ